MNHFRLEARGRFQVHEKKISGTECLWELWEKGGSN